VRIAAEYGNTILKDNSRNEYMIKRLTDLADRTVWAIGKQLERGEASHEMTKMAAIMGEEVIETGDFVVNEKDKIVMNRTAGLNMIYWEKGLTGEMIVKNYYER
jgi:heterodisulfide reductase subunit C